MSGARRISHCSHWGAYTLLVEDNRIVGIEPFAEDPSPSPILRSVSEWATSRLRVLRPMVRSGWYEARRNGRPADGRGRGQEPFVPVSWDEALTLVSGEIERVRSDFGNASIFAGSYGWTSCGRFHHAATQLKRLLNLLGGFTGHVDTYSLGAGPVIVRHVMGNDDTCYGRATTLDGVAQNTETLVVFGAMTPRTAQNTAGGIGAHRLEEYLRVMVERGVHIVLVSPNADDIPAWVGAEWWPIRPNTDTALMLALAQEVVRGGGHAGGFLQDCTSGHEVYLDYLAGRGTDRTEKTAEWAQAITGLDAGAIRALAARMARTRTMVSASWSLQRAHHGEQPYWAAIGLASVLGQIGLPGGGVAFGYGSVAGNGDPFAVARSPAHSQLEKPNKSFIPVARISDLLLNPGGPFDYNGATHTYPDTRLVYWAGGNPFHHHQDLNRFSRAWERPETIVVQDPMWAATALRADIVLPASTSLERNDIAGTRVSDVVVAMQQAIEPVGEARSDYRIFADLAERLGVADAFTEGRDEMAWVRHLYDTVRQDAEERFDHPMPAFEDFWRAGFARVPVRRHNVHLEAFRADPAAHPLTTESGRIVLGSDTLAGLGYADCLPHPAWLPPAEWLKDGRPGLHLVSRQPDGRLHSQLEQGAASVEEKRSGREVMLINPRDARRRGIEDGMTVRLWNERGACLATATVSDTVRPDVVVLPTGSWFTPGGLDGLELSGNPNVLTPDIPASRFSQGCSAHTCKVEVEPWRGNLTDAAASYEETLARLIA